ncbi:MAG: hypothetical protein NC086_07860 [Alistipes sp.]|nr:hypothetical protein [Alistipes sp.]
MDRDILDQINDSEMILVGIGNELAYHLTIDWNTHKEYSDWKEIFSVDDRERKTEIQNFYRTLSEILEGKNYFIITINVDDLIYESGLRSERIVAPCGSKNRLQCRCEGEEGLVTAEEKFYDIGGGKICEKCGHAYEPNIYNTDYYNESGYLKQWNLYHKWLQGTLNKKLTILEFGCDFSLLSIIRLPFEKIAMINQKAVYYRINGRFPQVTAELKEKMKAVCCTPQEFFNET